MVEVAIIPREEDRLDRHRLDRLDWLVDRLDREALTRLAYMRWAGHTERCLCGKCRSIGYDLGIHR